MVGIANSASCVFNNNDASVSIKCPGYNFTIYKSNSNCNEIIINQNDGSWIDRFYSDNSILEYEYDEYNVLLDKKLITLDNSRKTCVTLYQKAKKYVNKKKRI